MIDDLPVAVALPAPLADAVIAWVEHDLGWQVVDADGSLPPALALADAPCAGVPWVAVTDGDPGDEAATALLSAGAEDVVDWPAGRARIPLIATRVDVHRRDVSPGTRLAVGGTAGGVGTSTVALAIGGLLAWGGATVLVVGGDALPALAGAAAQADATTGSHTAVPGVPGLSVAGRRGDAVVPWTGDAVIVDDGTRVTQATTLIVARPVAGLRRARGVDRPVVVNGHLPLRPPDLPRILGRQPLVQLPWSVRVAQAGVAGRVPTGLPGRWLRDLGCGLRGLERWS
jgi:hypothetical protein